MAGEHDHLHPTGARARIASLDALRGFAVLGILLMNIQFFAMIAAAYFNPTAFGDLSGVNFCVWLFQHVFADQKFMTIFSALFGAGIVLIGDRAESRGMSVAWLHYKRIFWLLILGAAHAYLLWYGDILVIYALCGLVVIGFRRRQPLTQFVGGSVMLGVGCAAYLAGGMTVQDWPAGVYQPMAANWAPPPPKIAAEIAAYQGDWAAQMAHRVPHALEFHTIVFLAWGFWRAGGLMLIGMALYRWGVFSADLPAERYRRLALIGLLGGLPLVLVGVYQQQAHGWTFDYSSFFGMLYNYWGSLLVALAYVSLFMLAVKGDRLPGLMDRLAAVGRMAFSNYIAQTVICTLIFYGHGLGWFGRVERWGQLLVVLAVWAAILLWSPWWLARFRYGPLEWMWRSLTYWQRQPFRRAA